MFETICETHAITVTVGLRAGYGNKIYSFQYAQELVQKYCNSMGFGVTMTQSNCVYTGGNEPCVVIGLVNYPRFPLSRENLFQHARQIGYMLAAATEQERFTIVTPSTTHMFESIGTSPSAQT